MTSSGDLRKRVTIQAETSLTDGAGGYALGWTTIGTFWAEIAPVSGKELYVDAHLEGQVTHRITMRFQSGVSITTDMIVNYNNRLFNIRGVLNMGESNHWLTLLVEEGVAL